MHNNGVLLRNKPTIMMTRTAKKQRRKVGYPRNARLGVGMGDFVEDSFDAVGLVIVVVGLILLWGFGLGPGADVSRTTPSGREKFTLDVGMFEVRLGLIPHFTLGPITNVSSPASSGGDSLVLGVGDVNGWLDVRGLEISDVGITTPSGRVAGRERARESVLGNRFDAVRC